MADSKKKVVRRVKANAEPTEPSRRERAIARVKAAEEAKRQAEAEAGAKRSTKQSAREKRRAVARQKVEREEHQTPKIFRPLVKLGNYFQDSWRELGEVEWPSRRATWHMTLGVIVFCLVIGAFVLLCDNVSQWVIQEVIL